MRKTDYNEIKYNGWVCPVSNKIMAELGLVDGESVTKEVMANVNARKFAEAAEQENKKFDTKDAEKQVNDIFTKDEKDN